MATKTKLAGKDGALNSDAANDGAPNNDGVPNNTVPAGGPLPESYEEARDELAIVVETLEAGGLSLDESLTLWERGQALAKACETFLAGARRRVESALAEETTAGADSE